MTGSSSSSSVWLWLTVQDSSGTPISEASVYWDGSYLGSTSSDGRVKIYTNYPPAIHSWSASKNGYDSKSDNVEIGSTSGGGFTVTLVKRYTSSPSTSYSNQCELGIDSSLGVVSGYGKYLKGTTVSFQVTPTTIDISTGVRYAFIGWSSYSPGGYNGNNNPATVKLDNDIFEIANWETQCWLEIDGGGGYTSCDSGWYKKGGLVNIEAFPLSNPIIIYHFNGWEGIPNTQTTALVQVDGPMNVRAVWSEDYSRVYMLGGFALAGSMILVFRKRSISKREFEKQVQLNKEKTVYNIIASSKAIINLNELANEVGLSEDQIRSIIEKFLAEGKVLGYYNATNNMFITNEYIRSYITEKITHSQT